MQRRISPALFSATNQTRSICMKQCATPKADTTITPENKAAAAVEAIGPAIMLRLVLTPPKFKNMMFPRIFKVTADKLPTLHDIIHQADDFYLITRTLPKQQLRLLANTLSSDMTSLKTLLAPLSGKNQRQLLDFIGLKRIIALGTHDSHLSRESAELEFFMISETVNMALRRKNHNYLYTMFEREQVKIAARPGFSKAD